MRKIMGINSGLNKFISIMSESGGTLSVLIIAFFLFGTIADVFMRSIFNKPIAGVIEYCSVLLPMMVFMSLALVQKNKGHINITIFMGRLTKKKRLKMEAINLAICLLFVSLMGVETFKGALHSYKINEFRYGVVGQDVNIWWVKIGITVGCWLLVLQYISDLLKLIGKLRSR
jgi:TRAP-type C4-dicarboxylate transport system permease small subunit